MGSFVRDEYIGHRALCALFNDGEFWEKARSGAFPTRITRDSHPTAPKANEPFCTRSQFIEYWTMDGLKIAIVHHYLRRDGSIGLSGRPDPKVLVIDGIRCRALDQQSIREAAESEKS